MRAYIAQISDASCSVPLRKGGMEEVWEYNVNMSRDKKLSGRN